MAKVPFTWRSLAGPRFDQGGYAVASRAFDNSTGGLLDLADQLGRMDKLDAQRLTNRDIAAALRGEITSPTSDRVDTATFQTAINDDRSARSELVTAALDQAFKSLQNRSQEQEIEAFPENNRLENLLTETQIKGEEADISAANLRGQFDTARLKALQDAEKESLEAEERQKAFAEYELNVLPGEFAANWINEVKASDIKFKDADDMQSARAGALEDQLGEWYASKAPLRKWTELGGDVNSFYTDTKVGRDQLYMEQQLQLIEAQNAAATRKDNATYIKTAEKNLTQDNRKAITVDSDNKFRFDGTGAAISNASMEVEGNKIGASDEIMEFTKAYFPHPTAFRYALSQLPTGDKVFGKGKKITADLKDQKVIIEDLYRAAVNQGNTEVQNYRGGAPVNTGDWRQNLRNFGQASASHIPNTGGSRAESEPESESNDSGAAPQDRQEAITQLATSIKEAGKLVSGLPKDVRARHYTGMSGPGLVSQLDASFKKLSGTERQPIVTDPTVPGGNFYNPGPAAPLSVEERAVELERFNQLWQQLQEAEAAYEEDRNIKNRNKEDINALLSALK